MRPSGHTFVFVTVFLFPFALTEDEYKYVHKDDIIKFKESSAHLGDEYGEKWMWIPGGNNLSHMAVLDSSLHGKFQNYPGQPSPRSESDVDDSVHLLSYTPQYPNGKAMENGDVKNLIFNSSRPTKIICHGWMSSIKSDMVLNITSAYLVHQEVNIIGVDWSELARNLFYPAAVSSTVLVGKYLASVIDALVEEKGAKYGDFHLIGHSLGAHVSGFAGKHTKQKLGRITGLDPALPGFQYMADRSGRLDMDDAEFVDVIHTCAGILGMSIKVGHVDFFPNGGTPYQPGCDLLGFGITQACSHSKSHVLFTESINGGQFWSTGCPDWDHFTLSSCYDGYVRMGEHVSPHARGTFYLKTTAYEPYAMGMHGAVY